MINDQFNNIIRKYNIEKTNNILYGTNIPKLNSVVPTPWKVYMRFDRTEYYFFYFDENGIKIYLRSGEGYIEIPWNDVTSFKMSRFIFFSNMTVGTLHDTYKFQISRFVLGCPWIKTNLKYLESVNYFYKNINGGVK